MSFRAWELTVSDTAAGVRKTVQRTIIRSLRIRYREIKRERELGTILLTGATGFLGVHIFRELLKNKIKTVAGAFIYAQTRRHPMIIPVIMNKKV